MSTSKHFPGLPPYVDPGFEARRIPEDVRGGLRTAWPVRRVEDQLAALATIDAIPGDQKAALNDAFRHAVVIIAGQAVMLEGQIEAATLLAAAYGLDDGALKEIEAALTGTGGEAGPDADSIGPPSPRDMYIAKAKDLEAERDRAVVAMESAEKRAVAAEKAAAKARADVGYVSNQVANLRATLATREAEFARVKAGFEKALEEARVHAAEASRPKEADGRTPEAIAPLPDSSPPAIILPPGVEAIPEAPPVAGDAPLVEPAGPEAADEPSVEAEAVEAEIDLASAPASDASKPAKNGRKAR